MVVATVENALLPSLVQQGADRALTDIVCFRIWGSGWLACCAWYVVTVMRLQNKRWRAMQDYNLQNSHGEGERRARPFPFACRGSRSAVRPVRCESRGE